MGTRGTYGIRIKGEDKLTYNHYDSYPSGLGLELLQQIRDISRMPMETLYDLAIRIRAVDSDDHPNEEEIAKLSEYHDSNVSSGAKQEWYSLLRKMQGDLKAHLKHGVMIDNKEFIKDSLFCEWGYIMDMDTDKFEVYQGFQTRPHEGRYVTADVPDGDYYPCKEVLSYDLDKLPSDEEFLADVEVIEQSEDND